MELFLEVKTQQAIESKLRHDSNLLYGIKSAVESVGAFENCAETPSTKGRQFLKLRRISRVANEGNTVKIIYPVALAGFL